MNSSQSIRVPKAAEIVAGKIRRSIVDGTSAPGTFLPSEARLIENFNVSRPTIREAIRILEFENLITVTRGARGGAIVQQPSASFVSKAVGVALQMNSATLEDVFEARLVIEPAAARLAAQNRGDEAGKLFKAHVEREFYTLVSEPKSVADQAAEFHRLLLSECGNKTFALLGVALHDLVLRHQKLYHKSRLKADEEETKARSLAGFRSHEKLAGMISRGEADKAEQHWRRHMSKLAEIILPGLGETSILEVLDDAN